jgi:hypothetical protein
MPKTLKLILLPLLLALTSLTAGCAEETIAVSVVGYNHISDESIDGYSINGAFSGPPLSPESGGGNFTCCMSIPEKWKPRMKVTVYWAYGSGGPGSRPPPPPQSAVVEIPQYVPEDVEWLHVHFYAGHKVKVVLSRYLLGHPDYPLPKEDWVPWTVDEAVVRNLEWEQQQQKKKGGDEK